MCKIFNKWKYGDTTKNPKYIEAKGQWLYKNKFMNQTDFFESMNLTFPIYTCEVKGTDGYYVEKCYNDFNRIIEETIAKPFFIRFPYPEQYSKQQMFIISEITNKAVKDYTNSFQIKINNYIEDLSKEIDETNAKIDKLLKK